MPALILFDSLQRLNAFGFQEAKFFKFSAVKIILIKGWLFQNVVYACKTLEHFFENLSER